MFFSALTESLDPPELIGTRIVENGQLRIFNATSETTEGPLETAETSPESASDELSDDTLGGPIGPCDGEYALMRPMRYYGTC